MKRLLTLVLALGTVFALALGTAGCSDDDGVSGKPAPRETTSSTAGAAATETTQRGVDGGEVYTYSDALTLAYDKNDLDASWDESTSSFITLADGSVRFDGVSAGAEVSGNRVIVKQSGTYIVSGAVVDGQIVVDCEETGLVRLVLNGADITCATGAPIHVKSAEKVILILADGTQNALVDGDSYTLEDSESDEPNAAVFSDSDLTINGAGSLEVTANYNDGITSKDALKIVSGDITVDAVNDAIKGKDCLGIKDPSITIVAGGDGLQSSNDTDADRGFICISGGILDITAWADGIQAETTLLVTAGDLTLTTGGGSANVPARIGEFGDTGGNWGQNQVWGGRRDATTSTTDSARADGSNTPTIEDDDLDSSGLIESDSSKALKAGSGVFIEGGSITVDSCDDSIHSNDTVEIGGGRLVLASGDDGIHADAGVKVDAGEIDITTSYEGIEGNEIVLNGGTIHIMSSDDGINGIASAADATGVATGGGQGTVGRGGQGDFIGAGDARLSIHGAYVAVDARGDGVDINGTVEMTDGTMIINGPTENMNGALDYYKSFVVTGGYLVAVGSSGMAEAPSDSSTQYSIMVNFDQTQAAGTLVHVEDENGVEILTFSPTKRYQSIVLTTPDLREGVTYNVYLGGTHTGTQIDGVYSGGTHGGGTQYASLTVSSVVTVFGAGGMMGGGGFPGGGTSGGGRR